RRQADIAGPAGDSETGEKVADLARRADRWRCRFDPGQPHHALDDLLPAIVVGGKAPHLDRSALVDAGLGLGDAERELQPAQLVDQSGALGVDAGEDTAARRRIEPACIEL